MGQVDDCDGDEGRRARDDAAKPAAQDLTAFELGAAQPIREILDAVYRTPRQGAEGAWAEADPQQEPAAAEAARPSMRRRVKRVRTRKRRAPRPPPLLQRTSLRLALLLILAAGAAAVAAALWR